MLQREIREVLREVVLGRKESLAESKSVTSWWDNLPGKRRRKVVDILGMSKGKDNKLFGKLDSDEQSEIRAYFEKHKGKVEAIELADNMMEGKTDWWTAGNQWLIKKATEMYRVQLAGHLKKRRSPRTFRYSPPDWQIDAMEALGKNDEEWFKAIKLKNL